jgi:AraC family transcriptional activator of mtrCDE
MDALTRLIQLTQPQATLELRCLLEGAFVVDHGLLEPGVAPFHLVLSGSCVIDVARGRSITLQAGDFVLFPHCGAHRIRDAADIGRGLSTTALTHDHDGMLPLRRIGEGAADVDLLCGRFDYRKGPAAALLKTLPDPLHVSLAGSASAPALQTLVALMRDEAERRRPGALAIVTALSQALFTMALRIYGEQYADAVNVLALLSDKRLGASVQALLAEPGRAWTIADLGDVAAMSRATYARRFRDRSGMTVWEFLTHVRMTIACDLLLRTKRSAADIGVEVGYRSEAAFGKAFRAGTGQTPGRYRSEQASGATAG